MILQAIKVHVSVASVQQKAAGALRNLSSDGQLPPPCALLSAVLVAHALSKARVEVETGQSLGASIGTQYNVGRNPETRLRPCAPIPLDWRVTGNNAAGLPCLKPSHLQPSIANCVEAHTCAQQRDAMHFARSRAADSLMPSGELLHGRCGVRTIRVVVLVFRTRTRISRIQGPVRRWRHGSPMLL